MQYIYREIYISKIKNPKILAALSKKNLRTNSGCTAFCTYSRYASGKMWIQCIYIAISNYMKNVLMAVSNSIS
jgi:hypothetical protein